MSLKEVFPQLSMPFPGRLVRWRVLKLNREKNRALVVPYIEGSTIMDRLDEAAGPENWSYDFELLSDGTVKGKLTVFGITKCNRGAVEENGPSAANRAKGDATDGLKRAAVLFGIGRYLARVGATRVPYDPVRRTFDSPELPSWGIPRKEERGKTENPLRKEEQDEAEDVNPPDAEDGESPQGQNGAATAEDGEISQGQNGAATAQDFWPLANQSLKQGSTTHEEVQALAQTEDWARAMKELRRRMQGQQQDEKPAWVLQLKDDDPEELLTELFGS